MLLASLYGVILVASLKLGYGVGLLLMALGIAVSYRVVYRLLRTYLWDQWRIINAETMERGYHGPPEAASAPSGGKGRPQAGASERRRRGKRRSGKRSEDRGAGAPGADPLADPAPGWRLDWRPLVVLVFAAVVLTILEYWGSRKTYATLAPKFFPYSPGRGFAEQGVSLFGTQYQLLGEYVYWAGFRVLAFFVAPALLILALPGERLRDYGLSTQGFFGHLWIYGVLFLIVLPAVIMVSFTPAFANHYPFYKPWRGGLFARPLFWRDFLAWELLYALQFFSLEFFFRGFLLHGLKRSLGAYSIFVMVVPYCMIHFGKPMPETLGAIAAGTVLGTLALRTRSIWAGVCIHVSVAWSMDWLALLQGGHLPKVW